jgi:hypothetical protein
MHKIFSMLRGFKQFEFFECDLGEDYQNCLFYNYYAEQTGYVFHDAESFTKTNSDHGDGFPYGNYYGGGATPMPLQLFLEDQSDA